MLLKSMLLIRPMLLTMSMLLGKLCGSVLICIKLIDVKNRYILLDKNLMFAVIPIVLVSFKYSYLDVFCTVFLQDVLDAEFTFWTLS